MEISSELRDRLQNHKKPGVSSKHYDRCDYIKEKREAVGAVGRKNYANVQLDQANVENRLKFEP